MDGSLWFGSSLQTMLSAERIFFTDFIDGTFLSPDALGVIRFPFKGDGGVMGVRPLLLLDSFSMTSRNVSRLREDIARGHDCEARSKRK